MFSQDISKCNRRVSKVYYSKSALFTALETPGKQGDDVDKQILISAKMEWAGGKSGNDF